MNHGSLSAQKKSFTVYHAPIQIFKKNLQLTGTRLDYKYTSKLCILNYSLDKNNTAVPGTSTNWVKR